MKQKNNHFFSRIILGTILTTLLVFPVSATGLQGSKIYTGAVSLLNDITTVLTVFCPLFGGAAALYFVIRRSMADEQDGKMWTKRISIAIICGVGGMLVSGLIMLLTSYFV